MLSPTKIGRFEVVSTLGQGAMGTVYKAVDPLIERTVAIKTINLNLSNEERAEFEERFYREAKSAGRLNHTNIVTIYDVGETGDIAYIAMEYLEGESLREMLDSGVVLPVDMIVKIASRIASALNYAHENHVVHRDIKPANIMITANRNVKIMDFGIAQIPSGSRTQLGTVLGSPKYMAPEQVAGQATDGKTDIFALGVVLYEMLTGTTPFNGDNLSAIMYKILNDEPAAPSTLNPRVPPVFDRIVGRALAKRPEDRYQSAREFARDLRNQDAIPQEALSRSSENVQSTRKAVANKTPSDPQEATVFLAPNKARETIASLPVKNGGSRQRNAIPDFLNGQLNRKVLLVVVAVMVVITLFVYTQTQSSGPGRIPAPALPVFNDVIAVPGQTETAVKDDIDLPQAAVVKPAEPAPKMPRQAASGDVEVNPHPAAVASSIKPSTTAGTSSGQANVAFAISPWGEIFVDGVSVGVSPPLSTLKLAPGKHTVEIRNQGFTPYRETVNLVSGESFKIRHKFR